MTAHPDVFEEIDRLRVERNAVILAHYYQEPEIQDLADHIGDSLQLSRAAQATDADVIIFCGVHFMAETAKILNPERVVLIPDLEAGCSLDESCPAEELARFKQEHPGHAVVSYINCSAGVKAISDIICTSANAVQVVQSFPEDQPIIFCPDRNLGRHVEQQTGRKMVLWPGTCFVHETFSEKALIELTLRHPQARVLAHPECEQHLLRHAHCIGSTSRLLREVEESDAPAFIVATEPGILHQMQKLAPGKLLLDVPGMDESCACNVCTYMRLITPEKLLRSLQTLEPRIELDEQLRLDALGAVERMLALPS